MRKTKLENDMTDRTSAVYAKNEIERSWKTDHVRFVMKTRQDNDVTEWASAVYTKNNIE